MQLLRPLHPLLLPPMVAQYNGLYKIIPHYLFHTNDKNHAADQYAVNQQKLFHFHTLQQISIFFLLQQLLHIIF